MPNVEKDLELEKLKGDPNMWMRLTMLSEDGETMKSVFTDKENPFVKNSAGAMDKIRSLAAEGKLYLREEGRSRHFQAVNKDGDSLKLGEQHEMKMEKTASGTGLAILMWMSKHYLRWIGLDGLSKWLGFNGISNWFEKKLQDRRDAIEVDDRYSKEYKAMSNEKKKELKALRKHEKIMKKLEQIQKEAKLSEHTLNGLRGQQTPTTTWQAPTTTQQAPTTTQQAPTTQQSIPTPPQQSIPTPPQQSIPTPPQQSIPTPPQQSIPTPPQQSIPTPPQQSIPTPPQQSIPTPPQQNAPLAQPPEIKTNENTMQPTLTGDVPVQQTPPAPKNTNQFAVQQATQQEIPGIKKEENKLGEDVKDNKIIINGVELTHETVNQFPPQVVEAFRVIQQLIIEQETAQRANQQEQASAQPEANREEQAALTDVEQPTNLQGIDDLEMNQNEPVMNTNQPEDVYLTVNTSNVEEREMTQEELERMFAGTDAPTMDSALPVQEIDAPLAYGTDLEPDQVNMQQRHVDQAQMNLQERLAAEKEAMESVVNWQERLSNTLFSKEEVSVAKDYYEMIKDKPDGQNLLAGTVCGLLSASDQESKKQIMEGLLSGKPLGNEHSSRINESVTAYNHAVEQMSQGDREPMTKLITNAALELGRQASQEDGLSSRHVMIGRMISNAMSLADKHSLQLKFNDEQWATIRGAYELSKLAQRHHDAKQLLRKENIDMTSKTDRNAARDLLMGNAVESLIKVSKYHGQQTTDIQILMGCGCLTVDNLTKLVGSTQIRKDITEERVRDIMEMPNGFSSARMAKQLGEEILTIAQGATDINGRNRQIDKQKENQPENEQQLDPAQLMSPG